MSSSRTNRPTSRRDRPPPFLVENDQHSVCPWKGTAAYFDIVVDGQTNRGAAWYYADPKPAAEEIRDRVAFWKGVAVEA
ncbi:MAG: DUF427 domain-containing protein [Acidimicrobiia bacterium]